MSCSGAAVACIPGCLDCWRWGRGSRERGRQVFEERRRDESGTADLSQPMNFLKNQWHWHHSTPCLPPINTPPAGARLIGLEYIISERLFRELPEQEKKYWHSHR